NLSDIFTIVATFSSVCAAFVALYTVISSTKSNKRLQANKICAWIDNNKIVVSNASENPVYEVFVISVSTKNIDGTDSAKMNQGDSLFYPYSYYAILPSGVYMKNKQTFERDMNRRFFAEVCFLDNSGKRWVRNKDGILKEVKNNYLFSNYNYDEPRALDNLIPYNRNK
ncbi:hypothetical protein HU838_002617, partial [Listeria monocytogenes]|nr:hypothetical protein [Listeria monocytogenes]EEO3421964.1 hypothetical protein [Listeria monocytogenes]EFT8854373.1 hypothetical protein [Listeria monocytogenes]EFT8894003.1 hypothetical protein [Listeria monocytogenes]EFT8896961.1 hypothetical protein [Listeria monocytogenes]